MKLNAYTVLDRGVSAFLPVFWCRNAGEAIRSFSDAVMDGQHQFAKHPDDYILYFVGEFDDASGKLVGVEPMRLLGAREVINERTAGSVPLQLNGSGERATSS